MLTIEEHLRYTPNIPEPVREWIEQHLSQVGELQKRIETIETDNSTQKKQIGEVFDILIELVNYETLSEKYHKTLNSLIENMAAQNDY